MYCSPLRIKELYDELQGTTARVGEPGFFESCYTIEELEKIAKEYSVSLADLPDRKIDINAYKRDLWKRIYSTVKEKRKCTHEVCWVRAPSRAADGATKSVPIDVDKIFRPVMPRGKKQWLSNFDIDDIMAQYEDFYEDYAWLGSTPIDFKVWKGSRLAELKMGDLYKNGKRRYGLIINLDKHNQSGSHWVAVYINLCDCDKPYSVEYYDSVGKPPKKEILTYMNEVRLNAFMNLGLNTVLRINKLQAQYKDTECGVYATHFIVSRLQGTSFDDYAKLKISDDTMNSFRKLFFRPYAMKGGADVL